MKKIFFTIIFSFISLGGCFAEVILTPQWSEFCPPDYIDARANKGFWDSQKLGKYNDYWLERKNQFNEALKKCSDYKADELKSCYEQIKDAELNKNKVYNEKMEKIEALSEQRHREYIQQKTQQDTVNSINSIIRTIKY